MMEVNRYAWCSRYPLGSCLLAAFAASCSPEHGVHITHQEQRAQSAQPAPPLPDSDNTIRLKGRARVENTGTLTYGLPLSLMEAGNELMPALSLTYASAATRSAVAYGWALSGVSRITRCSATLAIDGRSHRPDQSAADRFCLDGHRLIAVRGAYGADGTEYRTFHDIHARIVSRGVLGTGPASFEVWRKDGLIDRYGLSPQSRVEGARAVLEWGLTRTEDRHGNAIEFTYLASPEPTDLLVETIAYGGNPGRGVAHPRGVKLIYGPHPNPRTRVRAGGNIVHDNHQLRAAVMLSQGQEMWRYTLAHRTTPNAPAQLLASVTQCFPGNDCSRPITFGYQAEADPVHLPAPVMVDGDLRGVRGFRRDASVLQWSDLNGDGVSDLFAMRLGEIRVRYGNRNGLGTAVRLDQAMTLALITGWNPTAHPVRLADLDRDGFADLLIFLGNRLRVAYGKATGFSPPADLNYVDFGTDRKASFAKNSREVVDLNHDGYADLVAFNYLETVARYGTGNRAAPFGPSVTLLADFGSVHVDERYDLRMVQDITGDGYGDLLAFTRAGVKVSRGSATGHEPASLWLAEFGTAGLWNPSQSRKQLADVNGDGYVDIVGFNRDGVKVALGTEARFLPPQVWVPYFRSADLFDYRFHHALVTDVNHDGLPDFVGVAREIHVVLNTGAPQTAPAATKLPLTAAWSLTNDTLNQADVASDDRVDVILNHSDGVRQLTIDAPRLLLKQIVDSHGHKVGVEWGLTSDPTLYTTTRSEAYPKKTVRGPIPVVSAVVKDDGQGGAHRVTQRYEDGVLHREGFGFLGFAKRVERDERTGILHERIYSQDVTRQTFGALTRERRILQRAGGTSSVLSDTHYQYLSRSDAAGYWQIEPDRKEAIGYDLAGKRVSRETTIKTFSVYGELLTMDTTTTDDYGTTNTTLVNTYAADDPARWLLGKVSRAERTSVGVQLDRHAVASTFAYDAATGDLRTTVFAPGTPHERTTTLSRDPVFGLVVSETVSVGDARRSPAATQVTTYRRDAQGHEVGETDPNGLSSSRVIDARTGQVLEETDPTGRRTTLAYNARLEQRGATAPDGSTTEARQFWCQPGACPPGAILKVVAYKDRKARTRSYLDALGRKVRQEERQFGGRWARTDFAYNGLGVLERESQPYFAGDTPLWDRTDYDELGRVARLVRADGSQTSYAYEGLSTTATDANGHRKTVHKNALGQEMSTVNHLGERVRFTYNAQGKLASVADAAGNTTRITYDVAGQRRRMEDAALGVTEFDYNGFGQLVGQKSPVTEIHHFYDAGGRKVRSVGIKAGQSNIIHTWAYDPAGRLLAAEVVGQYAERYTYDALSRPATKATTIDGQTFAEAFTYTSRSNLATHLFPSGLTVRYQYDQDRVVGLADDATGRELWRLSMVDARGNAQAVALGNGLTSYHSFDSATGRMKRVSVSPSAGAVVHDMTFGHDRAGNVTGRHNLVTGAAEDFAYDPLNRLTAATHTQHGRETVEYDPLGNIVARHLPTETRRYRYDAACGALTGNLHAVCRVETLAAGGVGPVLRTDAYSYDAGGNRTSGRGQRFTFDAMGKASRVEQGSRSVTWLYGPDGKRVKRIDQLAGARAATETFTVGAYQLLRRGAAKKHRHTLAGGVVIERSDEVGAPQRERYLHADHLGSPVTVTDEAGRVIERREHDAWGRLRSAVPVDPFQQVCSVGFTGHEDAADLGLVHMQGRVYDAELGRFISADPFVQAPGDTASLNRYTYVWNNPLTKVDPSGYFVVDLFKGIAKAVSTIVGAVVDFFKNYGRQILSVAIMVAATIVANKAGFMLSYAIVAGGGFASSYVASDGDLKSAFLGAATAVAFYGVGSVFEGMKNVAAGRIAAHGMVGGLSSVARGDDFLNGFAAAGLSQGLSVGRVYDALGATARPDGAFDYFYSAAVAGAVGGGTSRLFGGSFKSGFATAAFGRLFNDTLHSAENRAHKQGSERATKTFGKGVLGFLRAAYYRIRGIKPPLIGKLGGPAGTIAEGYKQGEKAVNLANDHRNRQIAGEAALLGAERLPGTNYYFSPRGTGQLYRAPGGGVMDKLMDHSLRNLTPVPGVLQQHPIVPGAYYHTGVNAHIYHHEYQEWRMGQLPGWP